MCSSEERLSIGDSYSIQNILHLNNKSNHTGQALKSKIENNIVSINLSKVSCVNQNQTIKSFTQNHSRSLHRSKKNSLFNSIENSKVNKRPRRSFNHFQLTQLEESFQKCIYADLNCRNNLCKLLNIPENSIQIWFQNRRAKLKKCGQINAIESKEQVTPSNKYNSSSKVYYQVNNVSNKQAK
uniref:Retinal homeobox-1 n=1 Tax=Tetracapsuloides bryosalmonae TaxID=271932 RepID=A0A859IQC2_9CNID|nr:retinal homeobox-1 [Tetracapsuloides bryosalmonae]